MALHQIGNHPALTLLDAFESSFTQTECSSDDGLEASLYSIVKKWAAFSLNREPSGVSLSALVNHSLLCIIVSISRS